MKQVILASLIFAVAGCGTDKSEAPAGDVAETPEASVDVAEPVKSQPDLQAILDAQSDDMKARYVYRNPAETLAFFGIEPGMHVVEGLPGGGWYTKILLPYLGNDGHLQGANYALDMWSLFPFANDEYLARQKKWADGFAEQTAEWQGGAEVPVSAFYFGSLREESHGKADAVLLVRALHNAARFQNAGNGDYLKQLLTDSYNVLKSGGILGIVQHEARADTSDEFASGANGYLKKAWVIEQVEAAGFTFVAESDVNQNASDQPGDEDIVWRLPPTLATSRENEELKAELSAIGESNRMTLKFVKP